MTTTAMATSILIPSLVRARELAKRAVTLANLRGLVQGCYIYSNDHDEQFPDSLAVLIEEDLALPKMLVSPRHGPGEEAYIYITGQSPNVDPRNVLMYEIPRGDEGVAAVFADGHAQWLKPDEFRRFLQQTYERLGREDELPAQYRP